jgi:hypothetical protein
VESQVAGTDNHGQGDQPRLGHVRIDQPVEVVKQETGLVRRVAGQPQEVLLGQRERAGPGSDLNHQGVSERSQVQARDSATALSEGAAQRNPTQ